MLVSMRDMVYDAWKNSYAVGGFDAWNIDCLLAVVRAAQKQRSPAIVLTGPWGMGRDETSIEYFAAVAKIAAGRASVPIAILLNEAPDLELIRAAVRSGYTGVMFERHGLTYQERADAIRQVVRLAAPLGIGVEGQLDDLHEGIPDPEDRAEKTDPSLAKGFVRETGIDILSVSVGNVHCNPHGRVALDLDLLARLRESLTVPFSVHGGSSVPDDMVREATKLGVAKFNVGRILREHYACALHDKLEEVPTGTPLETYLFVEEVSRKGCEAVEALAAEKMKVFASAGRAG